ncbi:hypothetical protein NKH33_12415 [Mesorhizobium sp. M1182]|uniref:hypothetical protein n=1 Tax=Mesorhizobium sp. M1182 TaxID=2957067 RepID=UPI00333DBDFE
MYTKKTVFVVGAGGSREVGLPMGTELAKIIGRKLDFKSNGWEATQGDTGIYDGAKSYFKKQGSEVGNNEFMQAGRALSSAMANAVSIDNYLHTHGDNDVAVFMGKMGISQSILEAERGSKIHGTNEIIDFRHIDDSWHNTFFKMATEGTLRANLGGLFSNVSIITFNYDRCIEHYLEQALQNYYHMKPAEAQKVLRGLEIIHPYGQVGRLPWQAPGGIKFGQEVEPRDLPDIAFQIRTFTERIEDEAVLGRIRAMIAEAAVIVYLGFSYGDMNMDLMTIEKSRTKSIFGTGYMISAPNRAAIENRVRQSVGGDTNVRRIEIADLKCNEFLNGYWRPIILG